MEEYAEEQEYRRNKSLTRVYCLLFTVTLATVILSIISSEHMTHFELK